MKRPVPVLMYHHVNPHRGDTVTVTPEVFEGQMRYLAEASYRTLTLDELLAHIDGSLELQEKAVVVTFDDGWLDNYLYAWPVLRKYGIKATIFIVTDRTEQASARPVNQLPATVPSHNGSKALIQHDNAAQVVLTWEHVSEMDASGLVEFHSHTLSHRKCHELPDDVLRHEIVDSKSIMEERVGKPSHYLCWPYGKFDYRGVGIAQNAGYRGIFTTIHGVARPGDDPFGIRRIVVKDSVSWFRTKMRVYTSALFSDLYLRLKKK
ncbi:MAG: polysaccharide deacetylase family protein [Geobacter sp.]|nr:polysaccharide deacetylase family protein [Geobacter sp.]